MNSDATYNEIINNEFDYSNILPTAEMISHLVRYCDEMNKQLQNMIIADEEKNRQLKAEYKEFMYSKTFSQKFEVNIKKNSLAERIVCNNYNDYVNAVQSGQVINILGLDIKLFLNFKRGKGNNLAEHENSFIISFKPYDIKFNRKSNNNDSNMNQVEQQINEILKKFPIANSIFCSK